MQAVQTGVQDFDAWFKIVHSMQVAVNESERVKLQIVSRLGAALAIGETSELEACAAAIRSRAESMLRSNKRVAFQFDAPAALNSPPPVLSGPRAGAPFPPLQDDAEATITVTAAIENGPLPQSGDEMSAAVRRAIRSTLALRKRMYAMVTYGPQILAVGRALQAALDQRVTARASELRPEFRDALEFLEGLGARANVEAQSAFRIAVRLQASAVVHPPEDEEAEATRRRALDDAALPIDAVPVEIRPPLADAQWWPGDGAVEDGGIPAIDGGRHDAWHPPDVGAEDVPTRTNGHRAAPRR